MSENDIALPEGWAAIPLEACVEILDSIRIPINSKERANRKGNIPYYGATGQVGWIDDYLFDEEILLLGEDGAPFLDKSKPIAYIVRGKSWVNNHAHVLKAIESLMSNSLLKYYLDDFDFNDYVNGSTRLKLTQTSMKSIPVRLPPLAEQKRIVAKVETILTSVDKVRTRLDRIPDLFKRLRQSILAAAVSGKLTKDWREEKGDIKCTVEKCCGSEIAQFPCIPDGWVYTKIMPILTNDRPGIKTGPFGSLLKKHEHQDGGVPVLGIENINRLKFVPGSKIHITEEKALELSQYDAVPGDILISRSGTVGEACVVPKDIGKARISTNLMRVSVRDDLVKPFYFAIVLCAPGVVLDQVKNLSASSTRDFLNTRILQTIVFPIPSLEEQEEIVYCVEQLFKLADKLEARCQKAKQAVDKLTQSILAKALHGELVPTEAELARQEGRSYETAEALLARIREELAQRRTEKKTRRKSAKQERITMKKLDRESVEKTISSISGDTFSFDELRKKLPGDYDEVKDMLFAMLEDAKSGLEQVFDKQIQTMRFRWGGKV